MSDALYSGSRFRTFNVIDDFNRECLAVEIDTSITGHRLIRVFEQLRQERGLPRTLRVDNGPNAYIERFNRTYREEFLSLYLFSSLNEVREATYHWKIDYNERRPHDALGDFTPEEYRQNNAGNSTLELST